MFGIAERHLFRFNPPKNQLSHHILRFIGAGKGGGKMTERKVVNSYLLHLVIRSIVLAINNYKFVPGQTQQVEYDKAFELFPHNLSHQSRVTICFSSRMDRLEPHY